MKTIHIQSIHQLHQLAGIEPPQHPLFSIHRIEDLNLADTQFPESMTYSFYTVGLKKNLNGYIRYGRTQYDFQEGALGFAAPHQLMEFGRELIKEASGWLLFFEKELMNGSGLKKKINQHGFFEYHTNEGLHLSKKEDEATEAIFENILREYNLPIDQHSKQVVLSNLELLLTYSERYYARQFLIRNEVDATIITRLKEQLQLIFDQNTQHGLPTVEVLAERLNLSPNYLSDYLKSTTGKTTLEHIHDHIIESAKNDLLITQKSIAEIAFELGFEYPHYFSRLFKKKTGLTPSQFRKD